jgi:Fe-S cluster biosynthesis and repair protein YggX
MTIIINERRLNVYTDTQMKGLEIELKNLEDWMMGEDWYINLFRLSNYAKAS